MRNRRRFAFAATTLAGFALLAVLSCGKKGGGAVAPKPGPSTATLSGLVVSLSGSGPPVTGATIVALPTSGSDATTNAQGRFSLTVPTGVVNVTVAKTGFAPHPMRLDLTSGITRTAAVSLLPISTSPVISVSSGGSAADPATKTSVALPPGTLTGVAAVVVDLTGLDPTSFQALAMPETFVAKNLLNATGHLRPVALADFHVSDGLSTEYTLATPAQLELAVPAAMLALPELAPGSQVECYRYDDATASWLAFAMGAVTTSSVYASQQVVKVPVTRGGWIAAGLLDAQSACFQGTVSVGGTPAAGVDLQAFPGGTARTDAAGAYTIQVPPSVPVQLIATQLSGTTINAGASSGVSGAASGACLSANIDLQSTGAQTFRVEAQLMRGRDAIGVPRDEAFVKITVNNLAHDPVNGATVEINSGTGWEALPGLGAGLYGKINGQGAVLNLAAGASYGLRVDVQSDGTIDGTSTVMMPATPQITTPAPAAQVDPTFDANWIDPSGASPGYAARYIGSCESSNFGDFPARFVVAFPTLTKTIGDGVFDATNHMANTALLAGEYTFRLWATNGPVRYPVDSFVLFSSPNVIGTGITGWFSAIAQADSVKFTSLGPSGPQPSAMRRNESGAALDRTLASH